MFYLDGATIRAAGDSRPLMLGDPASILLTHRTGSVLLPSVVVSRIDLSGTLHWTCGTGLRDLDQVLPDATPPIFVGRLPALEGEIPAKLAIVIDVATGTFTALSLQP